jgi:hypothetical protein
LLFLDHLNDLGSILNSIRSFFTRLTINYLHLRVGSHLVCKHMILRVWDSLFFLRLPSHCFILLFSLKFRQNGGFSLVSGRGPIDLLFLLVEVFIWEYIWVWVFNFNWEGIYFVNGRLRRVGIVSKASSWVLVRIIHWWPNFIAVYIYLSIVFALYFWSTRNSSVAGHNTLYLVIRILINWLQVLLNWIFLCNNELFHILIDKIFKVLVLNFLFCFVLEKLIIHGYLFWTVNNR